jgi:predicted nucleic acid-binding protein
MHIRRVIVDANIAFRTLAGSRGDLRSRFDSSDSVHFIAPRFLFVELFKHKERLVKASGKSEDDVLEALHVLVESMEFADESTVCVGTWMEAHRLASPTDPKDTPYVAMALHFGAELWTEDRVLKDGLKARGFTSFFEPR